MKTYGFITAILAAIAWGVTYTLDQKLLERVSPMVLVSVNGALNLAFALPVVLLNEGTTAYFDLFYSRSWVLLLVFVQAIAFAANYLIYMSIVSIGATVAAAFEVMYPLFVALFFYAAFSYSTIPSYCYWWVTNTRWVEHNYNSILTLEEY